MRESLHVFFRGKADFSIKFNTSGNISIATILWKISPFSAMIAESKHVCHYIECLSSSLLKGNFGVSFCLFAGKPELRGYNLSPLSSDEIKAINGLLKKWHICHLLNFPRQNLLTKLQGAPSATQTCSPLDDLMAQS